MVKIFTDEKTDRVAKAILHYTKSQAQFTFIPVTEDVINSSDFQTASPSKQVPATDSKVVGFTPVIFLLAQQNSTLVGENATETAEIEKWVKYAGQELTNEQLPELNHDLWFKTFFVSNHLTVADIALYAALYTVISSLSNAEQWNYCNVSRWFDYVQFILGVNNPIEIDKTVPYDWQPKSSPSDKIQAKPVASSSGKEKVVQKPEKVEQKQEKVSGTEKSEQKPTVGEKKEKQPAESKQEKPIVPLEKKEKRPNVEKKSGDGKKAPIEEASEVSKLDIRVGFIRKAWKHPDADSLYCEEIDIGEPIPRPVVSGLANFIPLEQMQQIKVCVLCNLKPAAMRGIKSFAMVMAGSDNDHTKVELVTPPEGAKIGERIMIEGFAGDPEEQLNPKKKTFENVQPDFSTTADLVATYKGVPWMTSAGPCKVASLVGASIK